MQLLFEAKIQQSHWLSASDKKGVKIRTWKHSTLPFGYKR